MEAGLHIFLFTCTKINLSCDESSHILRCCLIQINGHNKSVLRFIWAQLRENLSSGGGGGWGGVGGGGCKQQRRRPACASAQSDQRLCYSLIKEYNI